MEKYKRLSADEKWEIIRPIIKSKVSVNSTAKKYGISTSRINEWVRKYNQDGMAGLEKGKRWKQYSAELKANAVRDVVVNGMSSNSVIKKYEISSDSVLKRWINSYNIGNKLEATSSGKVGTIMTKGRKTTFEERIEITEFIIARDYDYKAAQEKFNVSYSQAYSWVKKYEKNGKDGLQDKRGRGSKKKEVELSELEKLKLENKRMKERIEYLEMKDAFGKKLKELEHRYGRFR